MPLKQDYDHLVGDEERAAGEAAFRAGRVVATAASASGLSAQVRSQSRTHRVAITNSGVLRCTCSDFDGRRPCEHLWAFMCQVDYDTSRLGRPVWQFALDNLARREGVGGDAPAEERRVRYAFSWRAGGEGEIGLKVLVQARRKDGQWGVEKVLPDAEAESLTGEDAALVAWLRGPQVRGSSGQETWRISPDRRDHKLDVVLPVGSFILVLPRLVATGRLVIAEEKSSGAQSLRLDEGPAWEAAVAVRGEDELRLAIEFRRDDEIIRAEDIDTGFGDLILVDHVFHRVSPADAVNWVAWNAENEVTIKPRDLDRFYLAAQETSLGRRMDVPSGWTEVSVPADDIKPVLILRKERGGRVAARAAFDYGDGLVDGDDPMRRVRAESREVLVRRPEDEEDLLQQFRGALWESSGPRDDGSYEVDPGQVSALVSSLQLRGWRAEIDGTRLRGVRGSTATVRSGIDWFDLEGGIQFGDETVSYPDILRALRKGEKHVVLSDGSHGMLPEEWLRREGLLSAAEIEGDGLRFTKSQGVLLDILLQAAPEPDVDAQFRQIINAIESFRTPEAADEPDGFVGELRPYQREGLGWIGFLEQFGFGGCLADDMGLGKTVQVLAYLQERALRSEKRTPTLVVAPRSVASNWIAEAKRFTPALTVLDYSGSDRRSSLKDLPAYDLVVTTYGLLRRDIQDLKEIAFGCAVLDESQAIKNARSQTAKASRLLKAGQRLALSGTPIENHVDELWSLFQFLNPGMFGSLDALRSLAEGGEDDQPDHAPLARALRPFILRRKKEEVAKNLPARSEQTLVCDLPDAQRKVYDDLLKHYRASIATKIDEEGLGRAKMHVLEALTRLRQAACHPGLLDPESTLPSAKNELLLERLREVISEGHKALVFSQFTKFLALVRKELDASGITYEYLDGQSKNREKLVQRFQEDEDCPVFLISLKAGGTGLNLTAADYVFLLDPWWNPAVEAQAIDRAHRIGQTRNVFAYRLIARDTIEEKILALQDQKRALAESILSGGATTLRDLSAEDLELLLS